MIRDALLILFLFILSNFAYAELKGDVTGDGEVNGKDALKIMRIVEGYDERPGDDDPFWSAGDVYPLPGTNGRIIGDGEVDRNDAEKILQYVVGLIPLGELTGEFEGPLITGFQPRSGNVGTRVILTGINFASVLDENIVEFGGISARVLSATPTRIETEVPDGAVTGPIRVRTWGGEAITRDEFTVLKAIRGRVELPAGLNLLDYAVASSVGVGTIDAQGTFDVPGRDGAVTFVGVVPKSEDAQNAFLGFLAPDQNDQSEMKINARSTAETLILCQPMFLTDDPGRIQILKETMANAGEVEQLADLIERKWVQDTTPLDDPEVVASLSSAVAAVNDALLESGLAYPGEMQGAPAPAASPTDIDTLHLDIYYMKPKVKDGSVIVDSRYGNPLDWIAQLAQVDPNDSDFDRGLYRVPRDAVFDRTGYKALTVVPSKAFFSKFDLLGLLAGGILKGILGSSMKKPELELNPDAAEDSIYVLRMFSGVLHDASPNEEDSALMRKLPGEKRMGYPEECYQAMYFNILLASLDAISILIDMSVLGDNGTVKVLNKMKLAFDKSFLEQFPDVSLGEILSLDADELFPRLLVISYAVVKEGLKAAIKEMVLSPLKALCGIFKTIIKVVDVFGKVAKVGKLMERIAGMAGVSVLSIAGGEPVTPLESALVVVGDPFGPKIEDIDPKRGLAGEEITLIGVRFARKVEENEVRFGNIPAKVVTVNDEGSKLTVEVPNELSPGMVKISVTTPKGGPFVSRQYFTALRIPRITDISPKRGFQAADDFGGQPFPGTEVIISVKDFDPEADPPDEVYFGEQKAEIKLDGTSDTIKALVPAGVGEPGMMVKVRIKAPSIRSPSGKISISRPFPFILQGTPHIDDITPKSAPGSARILISGAGFSRNPSELKVLFDGSIMGDILSQDYGMIEVRMPSEIPEGQTVQVVVVTPVGTSNPTQVTREKGLAPGAIIMVREGLPSDPNYVEYITLERAIKFATGEAKPRDNPDPNDEDPPYEEADQIRYRDRGDRGMGSGFADTIRIITEGYTFDTTIRLGSYDALEMGLNNTFAGGMELTGKGCVVRFRGDIITGGVNITGSDNDITPGEYPHAGPTTIKGGVTINDGTNNRILKVDIEGLLKILGGGLNTINGDYSSGVNGGVWIDNSKGNTLENLKLHGSQGNGILITNGSSGNVISNCEVYENSGDGIRIENSNDTSVIMSEIHGNSGNGVTITDGSKNNSIQSKFLDAFNKTSIYSNGGDGILISGEGCDSNSIDAWIGDFGDVEDRRNGGYGIAVVDGPKGTRLAGRIGANRLGGVRISNVSSDPAQNEPPVVFDKYFQFGVGISLPRRMPIGFLFENGARNIEVGPWASQGWLHFKNVEYGIFIRGQETSHINFNECFFTATEDSPMVGLLVTGGAHDIKLSDCSFSSFDTGIRVEEGAHDIEIIDSDVRKSLNDGVVIDNADSNLIKNSKHYHPLYRPGDIHQNGGNGIVIRNSSSDNKIQSLVVKQNGENGILIGDSNTTVIEGCGFTANRNGMLVEGATDVTIGGALDEQRNYIADNTDVGIKVTGKSSATFIIGNVITGDFWNTGDRKTDWGIVIDGQSEDVFIGQGAPNSQREVPNEIRDNDQGGILISGDGVQRITVRYNYIGLKMSREKSGNGNGIVLKGVQKLTLLDNKIAWNTSNGIIITDGSHDNILTRNMIYDNGGDGILVTNNSVRNNLRGNVITGNGGKGIRLTNGGNQMIDTPVIEVVSPRPVRGKVQAPNGSVVDLHADVGDEGETYIGSGSVVNNRFYINAVVPPGKNAHCIVTDQNGNTSEFGPSLKPPSWGTLPAVIAFTSTRDGDMEIYMFEGRSDNPVRVTNQPGPDHSPKVSPNLNMIAFVSERSGNPDIWVHDRTTGKQFPLTSDPAPDYDPCWSPDGQRIAFVSERDGNPEIYVMDADGRNVLRLVEDSAADRYPCWSPNGKMMAFTSERSGNQDIWVMNIADGSIVRATEDSAPDYRPSWSPDGNTISFISTRSGQLEVWSVGIDGSAPRQVFADVPPDTDPAWTPGGKMLFSSNRDGGWEIWIREIDGRIRRLTVSLGENTQPDGRFYSWGGESLPETLRSFAGRR
jgi:parallel beta-helix repeat protein